MTIPSELRTERLRLRRWLPADREPFAALNADPRVSEFLPTVLDREQSDAFVARAEAHFVERGFGLWAVEILDGAKFAGFVGLSTPRFDAHFQPSVEIGWRLSPELVSFTVPSNARSRRVMEKIGMRYNPFDDFDHPLLADGHPLRRHVLYRM